MCMSKLIVPSFISPFSFFSLFSIAHLDAHNFLQIKPIYKALSDEMTDLVFTMVDVDENEETAGECGVSAMPTFMFYKNGSKVGEMMGANPDKLKENISKFK